MILLVDQDGCISDIENGFLSKWKEIYPDEFYVPVKQRTTHMIIDQYPLALRQKVKSIYHAPGFFLELKPMAGAVEALREMASLNLDVRICTSPLYHYQNCLVEKYKWVELYFGLEYTKKIILTQDKTIVRGNYLIDDSPYISGICLPEWEHILFDAPYNRGGDLKRLTWTNWKQVLSF
ncbi:MAG: 5'-3'-deoxyribonucleotidase [Candidatus Sungbacteria bacterium]|nr:5'-3'-deoxyribonucleotidase [Candidatus Sungbacteria bacterium]